MLAETIARLEARLRELEDANLSIPPPQDPGASSRDSTGSTPERFVSRRADLEAEVMRREILSQISSGVAVLSAISQICDPILANIDFLASRGTWTVEDSKFVSQRINLWLQEPVLMEDSLREKLVNTRDRLLEMVKPQSLAETFAALFRVISSDLDCDESRQQVATLADQLISEIRGLGRTKDEMEQVRGVIPLLFAFLSKNCNVDSSESLVAMVKDLRDMARLLHEKYSQAAETYEKLYADFVKHKDKICKAITTAGKGRTLYNQFTKRLKEMALAMRRESEFWKQRAIDWQACHHLYSAALEQTPSVPRSLSPSSNVPPVAKEAQQVSKSFYDMKTAALSVPQPRPITTVLCKTTDKLTKRFDETRAYLVSVQDKASVADTVGPAPSLSKIALKTADAWDGLYNKFMFWLFTILKPLAKPFYKVLEPCHEIDGGFSNDLKAVRAGRHPYVNVMESTLQNLRSEMQSRSGAWEDITEEVEQLLAVQLKQASTWWARPAGLPFWILVVSVCLLFIFVIFVSKSLVFVTFD